MKAALAERAETGASLLAEKVLSVACAVWPWYGHEWIPSMTASDVRCADGRLLRIAFTTVFDYILLLRVVAQELQVC